MIDNSIIINMAEPDDDWLPEPCCEQYSACAEPGECMYRRVSIPPAPALNGAGGILTEALEIVTGARQVTHGEKERSFQVIGDLWTAYLEGRNAHDKGVTAFDVAQMMVLLKIARSIQGTRHRDHFVDAAGYAAIAGELA